MVVGVVLLTVKGMEMTSGGATLPSASGFFLPFLIEAEIDNALVNLGN